MSLKQNMGNKFRNVLIRLENIVVAVIKSI
jgi:hypothetical protein